MAAIATGAIYALLVPQLLGVLLLAVVAADMRRHVEHRLAGWECVRLQQELQVRRNKADA
ncbi:hypothetical protein [Actinopolymorpha pittospori]|uniref:Uncharacterized protein n=1 Tax=Actinopolymorpha pittospori TaxID=648752 RepID=A0A927MN53_9ACTN|nr:hypothetical protein [Actinopolymorpha pittospori]MBE1603756.1 hypothetical protein [Actinopolymorpha pittospori]